MMDKEVELKKIEVLNGYFQTWFTMVASIFTGGYIAVLVLMVGLFYQQGLENYLGLLITILVVLIPFGLVNMWLFNREYNRFLRFTDDLLKKVEKGETLPSITELRKKARK